MMVLLHLSFAWQYIIINTDHTQRTKWGGDWAAINTATWCWWWQSPWWPCLILLSILPHSLAGTSSLSSFIPSLAGVQLSSSANSALENICGIIFIENGQKLHQWGKQHYIFGPKYSLVSPDQFASLYITIPSYSISSRILLWHQHLIRTSMSNCGPRHLHPIWVGGGCRS